MVVVRVMLGVAIAALLVSTQPALSAVSRVTSSDPEVLYTVRVEPGKSHRVRFRLVEPRGDSIVEADQFDFIVSAKGLRIRPSAPTTATGTAGARLTFESFDLFLPTDGSPSLMEGAVAK
jgi:hypothetical protein